MSMLTGNSRSILAYAAAIILASGSNFLSVPILLSGLGPVEFGRWASVEPLVLAVIPISGFGLHIGLMRLLARENRTGQPLNAVIFYQFCLAAGVAILCFLTAFLLFGSIEIAIYSGMVVFIEGSILFCVSFWRATNQPIKFALVEGGRSLLLLCLIGMFLVVGSAWVANAEAYLLVRVLVGTAFLAFSLVIIQPRFRPNAEEAKRAIIFGLPLVVSGSIVSVLSNFDRFPVLWMGGHTAVSEYVVHVKVAQILGTALSPFFIWFAPIAIRKLDDGDAGHIFFRNSFRIYFTVNVAACVGLWAIIPSIWPVIFPETELNSVLMAILLLGMAVFSCGNPLSIRSLRAGESHFALKVTLMTLAVGCLLVLALAPIFGILGVAVAKAMAMTAYTVGFAVGAVYSVGVRYPWLHILAIAAFGISIAGLISAIEVFRDPWIAFPASVFASLSVIFFGHVLQRFWSIRGC